MSKFIVCWGHCNTMHAVVLVAWCRVIQCFQLLYVGKCKALPICIQGLDWFDWITHLSRAAWCLIARFICAFTRHDVFTLRRFAASFPVNTCILLDVVLRSIAEYFYELCHFWRARRASQNTNKTCYKRLLSNTPNCSVSAREFRGYLSWQKYAKRNGIGTEDPASIVINKWKKFTLA